jgi:hypothetical protein
LASNPEVSEFWNDVKDVDQLVNLVNAGLFMRLTAESPPGYTVLAPDNMGQLDCYSSSVPSSMIHPAPK